MATPVVIPAAGRGTRLRPLTDDRPKALVDVGGEPLLSRCFEIFESVDVSAFVVVVGYRGEQIRDRYGDRFDGVPITYTEQAEPRGLADAVATTEPHVDGSFVVCNGDNVLRGDVAPLVETHERRDAAATLLTESVDRETAKTRGVCAFDDDGTLSGFVEKPDDPPSTEASAGCWAFDEVVFDAIRVITPSERGEYELTDAIDLLLYAGHPVRTVTLSGRRVNVNSQADLDAAASLLD
ncbi:MAG: sugar phosphate nucleotidyltransferase [Halobacterium sp.]